ncbi:putative membrane protein [Azospirillum agricola]|uniref:DUF502 domain-containing protein n=1 Tax=Azospirillum agricola TaxID=1720247 RepID=UPI001AE7E9B5|nr:DUF502 domain-containing protein [Azospirillum agricola]MBP2227579.1 putative membrane protein [Azospirillum agricola]
MDRDATEKNGQPAEPPRPRREGIGFIGRLRAYFLAGVLVTAPIAITIYIAWWFVSFIDGHIRPLIPAAYNPENYLPFSIPGIGVLTVIIVVTLIGTFTAGYVGRLVLGLGEGLVERMPVVRSVYGAVKQIFETVLAKKSNAFREVVVLQYPRVGVWSLGFITGSAHPDVQRVSEEEMVNVFIPCAPPTAGYLVMVPRHEVTVLNMPVEDGLKLVMSGGIVVPPDRQTVTTLPGGTRQPERSVLAAASRSNR